MYRAMEGVISDTRYRRFFKNDTRYWAWNSDTTVALKAIFRYWEASSISDTLAYKDRY